MSETKNQLEGQKFSKGKLPYYTVLFQQFPLAIKEIVRCSASGHNKYPNDVDYMNFKRVENAETEYANAALRHMTETGWNEDMQRIGGALHEAQVIWNLLAKLQIELEQNKFSN